MAKIVADEPRACTREELDPRRTRSRSSGDGRELQGRDHRRTCRSADRGPLPPGRVRRPLPRSARAVDRPLGAFKLHARRRRVLARRRAQPDAAAHLRHRVPDRKALEEHLARLEEAKRRDHRKLGKQLDLFSFHREAPGSPFFHPDGALVYNLLVEYMREPLPRVRLRRGDHAADLRRATSGTAPATTRTTARTCSSRTVDEREFAVKPMNCPAHCLIYARRAALVPRSADPLRRLRPPAPLRALGRRARADARAHRSARTTRTSSARPSRSSDEIRAVSSA